MTEFQQTPSDQSNDSLQNDAGGKAPDQNTEEQASAESSIPARPEYQGASESPQDGQWQQQGQYQQNPQWQQGQYQQNPQWQQGQYPQNQQYPQGQTNVPNGQWPQGQYQQNPQWQQGQYPQNQQWPQGQYQQGQYQQYPQWQQQAPYQQQNTQMQPQGQTQPQRSPTREEIERTVHSSFNFIIGGTVLGFLALLFGSILMGAIGLILSIVGYTKTKDLSEDVEVEGMTPSKLHGLGIFAIVLNVLAIVLTIVYIALLVPYVVELMESGSLESILEELEAETETNSTWG